MWVHFTKQDENSAQCSMSESGCDQGGNSSNIMKQLQGTHGVKLKESGVFDCLNKVEKFSSPANIDKGQSHDCFGDDTGVLLDCLTGHSTPLFHDVAGVTSSCGNKKLLKHLFTSLFIQNYT